MTSACTTIGCRNLCCRLISKVFCSPYLHDDRHHSTRNKGHLSHTSIEIALGQGIKPFNCMLMMVRMEIEWSNKLFWTSNPLFSLLEIIRLSKALQGYQVLLSDSISITISQWLFRHSFFHSFIQALSILLKRKLPRRQLERTSLFSPPLLPNT